MKIDWKEEGKKVPFIVAGNAILALGVVAFIVPGGLISGGATGLALLISHLLPVDIEKDPAGLDGKMLLEDALTIMDTQREANVKQVLEQYALDASKGRATDDYNAIALALLGLWGAAVACRALGEKAAAGPAPE